jgi:hypothetical protein
LLRPHAPHASSGRWMLQTWSSAETIFSDRAVASCPHAIVVSQPLMARAPSTARAQPTVRALVGGSESASSEAASPATAAATQPLAPSGAPATWRETARKRPKRGSEDKNWPKQEGKPKVIYTCTQAGRKCPFRSCRRT